MTSPTEGQSFAKGSVAPFASGKVFDVCQTRAEGIALTEGELTGVIKPAGCKNAALSDKTAVVYDISAINKSASQLAQIKKAFPPGTDFYKFNDLLSPVGKLSEINDLNFWGTGDLWKVLALLPDLTMAKL